MVREYKTVSKTQLAQAYGFNAEKSIVRRIKACLHKLDDVQLLQLGTWTGNGHLMPDQVAVLVELLGTPSETKMLFSEK